MCGIFFNYLKQIFPKSNFIKKSSTGGKNAFRDYRMSLNYVKEEALPYYSEYNKGVANQP